VTLDHPTARKEKPNLTKVFFITTKKKVQEEESPERTAQRQ